mmetsp:Transcript_47510/g.94466  ORF Transcript_47510/g.94466 Transcript_47510/m.94466 type:complete len:632 (+) Transcript_47510:34-1929(+)
MASDKLHDNEEDRLRSLLREELATFHEGLVLELHNIMAKTNTHVPNQFCGTSDAPEEGKELGGIDAPKQQLCKKHEPKEKPYCKTGQAEKQRQNKQTTSVGLQTQLAQKAALPTTCVDIPGTVEDTEAEVRGVVENTEVDVRNSTHSQQLLGSFKVQNHFVEASRMTCSPNCDIGLNHTQVKRMQRKATQPLDDLPAAKLKMGALGGLTMRDALKNLTQEVYDVSVYYHDTGCAQALARSDKFMNFTLAMITLNTIYIGVDQDNNPSDLIFHAPWPFQVCENFFAVFFCCELLLRFFAFKKKRDCLRDFWFKIDSSLVLLMICEMWLLPTLLFVGDSVDKGGGPNASFLRLLRLLRISRMIRALRFMPELVSMVKGMRAAAQAVFTSLAMVMALVYIFAIVMNMALKDEPTVHTYFGNLTMTIWTLVLDGVLADSPGTVIRLLASIGTWNGRVGVLIFVVFILISCFFLMNMLIGVLCEVVNSVAEREKDEAAVNLIRETILLLLKEFDSDGNGMINQHELRMVMDDPRAVEVLKSLEVDVIYLDELQGMLFMEPDSEVRIQCALELLLSCRGSLPTTVKHMVAGQAFTRWMLCSTLKQQEEVFAAHLKSATKKILAVIESGAKPALAVLT